MNEPDTRTGRHPVNVGHLVMGLAFLGLVGVWALVQSDAVGNEDVRWLLPLPWVLAGLAGLLATTLGARRSAARRSDETDTTWVDPTGPDATRPDATEPDATEPDLRSD